MRQNKLILFTCMLCLVLNINAQVTDMHQEMLADHVYGSGMSSGSNYFSIVTDSTSTFLTYRVKLESDISNIWVGGNTTYIMDVETGTRYALRKSWHGMKLNKWIEVHGKRGEFCYFRLEFPRIPLSVKQIKIYGLPEIEKQEPYAEMTHVYDLSKLNPLYPTDRNVYKDIQRNVYTQYDESGPNIRRARMVESKKEYAWDDSTTYPVFIKTPKVYPYDNTVNKPSYNHISIWCTRDTTFLTFIVELTDTLTDFFLNKLDAIRYYGGEPLQLLSAGEYPIFKHFYIQGTPGDFVPITLRFPPLPLGTRNISISTLDQHWPVRQVIISEPDEDDEEQTAKTYTEPIHTTAWIGQLLENRKHLRMYADTDGGSIVR